MTASRFFVMPARLQFLWELHFIEAFTSPPLANVPGVLQFLWELYFIEASAAPPTRP